MARTRFLWLLFVLPLVVRGQVSQPYCLWEDNNSAYHLARLDPATATITPLNTITGMTGFVAPNTTVFKPTTGEYMCLALYSNTIVLLRMDIASGSVLATPTVTENWVGLKYNCANDTIYGLREDNNNYEFVWLDPGSAQVHVIAALPSVSAHVSSSFTLDADAGTYTFVGLSGASKLILTLDVHSGAIVQNQPFPYNVPGQFWRCQDGKPYGLVEDQQNSLYYLGEVLPGSGTIMPLYQLQGVTPGFIAESATYSGVSDQFTYRGFDSNNDMAVFAIDASNGSIVGQAVTSERLSGLEDSLCCTCPSPRAAFDVFANGIQAYFFDQTVGSPHSWLWDFGDGDTAQTADPVHIYSQFGTFTVCLTVENNCGTDVFCDTIVIAPTSVKDPVSEMQVYPVPFGDRLFVHPAEGAEKARFELLDVHGKVVDAGFAPSVVDGSRLRSGVYFLRLHDGDGVRVRRVVRR